MSHQVSVAFPKNVTYLEFFRVFLVNNKSFLSTFYQLKDRKPKENCPVNDRICPTQMQFMLNYWSNKKIPCKYQENIKITILIIKTKN